MAKKSFEDANNPVLNFISAAQEETPQDEQSKPVRAAEGKQFNFERKSKHVHLLMKPSLHKKLTDAAILEEYRSLNDLVHSVLDKYVEKKNPRKI